jgi:hypothetical protein
MMLGPAYYRVPMHVAFGRAAVTAAMGLMLTAVLAGCGTPPSGPSVPTFPDPVAASEAVGVAGPDEGAVPDDCARLLAVADLNALLGLPLDSVAVRTTRHVGSPSVGRTERVACEYTGQGGVRGRLLQLDVSSYTDADAALAQWRVNTAAENGTRTDLSIGSAQAVLLERRGEAVLRVVHGTGNFAFVLPQRPLPAGRSAQDILVDVALRVMPAIKDQPAAASAAPGTS